MPDTKAFYQDVYSIVKEIPAGRVATVSSQKLAID